MVITFSSRSRAKITKKKQKKLSSFQEPANFVPFDIDRYLAVKLLKELDIDPKLAL